MRGKLRENQNQHTENKSGNVRSSGHESLPCPYACLVAGDGQGRLSYVSGISLHSHASDNSDKHLMMYDGGGI
jgi:hypothetical protein